MRRAEGVLTGKSSLLGRILCAGDRPFGNEGGIQLVCMVSAGISVGRSSFGCERRAIQTVNVKKRKNGIATDATHLCLAEPVIRQIAVPVFRTIKIGNNRKMKTGIKNGTSGMSGMT